MTFLNDSSAKKANGTNTRQVSSRCCTAVLRSACRCFQPSQTAAGLAKISSSARVVMFATSWCPYCAEARGLFEKNGVRYTELDIECDESAKDFWSKFWG